MDHIFQEEAKREMEGGDEFIEIKVTSPHKVGDGMSSYMAYKVITNTNLTYFKKSKPEVSRRFSDFLGLRDKLTEKYLQNGRIIPPAPDKSVLGMTKVKMAKEDETSNQSGMISKIKLPAKDYYALNVKDNKFQKKHHYIKTALIEISQLCLVTE